LTINDVQLANLPGGSRADMLRVAEASADVDAWELRRGNIVVQRLVLRGVDLLIEVDEKGRSNFNFASGDPADPNKKAKDRTDLLLQRIGDVDIRDAKVTIRDSRDGQTQQLSLEKLRMLDNNEDDFIRVAAKGRLENASVDLPFDLEGRTGRLATLMTRDKPFPLDLRGTAAGMTVATAGTVADLIATTGVALRIDVSANNLSPVARLFGDELPSLGPAHLIASLSGNSETFSLDDILFELAENRMTGNLTFDFSGPRFKLDGLVIASWLDLTPWLTGDGEAQPERQNRLLNNDRIDFTELQDFEATLAISAETLIANDLLFRDADLAIAMAGGQLRVSPASARFDGRAFTGDLVVDSSVSPPTTSLNATARDFDIGRLLARIFEDEFIQGTGGLDFLIEGEGWSIAEIVGSSTGHARVLMDGGQVKTGQLDWLVGGIGEILPSFDGDDDEWTSINCVAGDFDLRAGVATSRVALLDSEILRLVGEGSIDLSRDTLEFYVSPSAKNITLNVAVPVNMSGPLADPSITPDEFSLLRRLGGLVGAVIFPPAALLSLGSLGSHDNPCLDAVQSAEVPPQPEEPEDLGDHPEAETPPESGTESAERLIDAVKQLLPLRNE
ncbi:MAG: AsmA family protein, partial [Alphaproteobacteria bacterium]|nr:AsmA family protein [Alphaproteobacteria bacterium]